jgi:hypothetical protein
MHGGVGGHGTGHAGSPHRRSPTGNGCKHEFAFPVSPRTAALFGGVSMHLSERFLLHVDR